MSSKNTDILKPLICESLNNPMTKESKVYAKFYYFEYSEYEMN